MILPTLPETVKTAIVVSLSILAYNTAVDRYAEWRLSCMKQIPLHSALPNNNHQRYLSTGDDNVHHHHYHHERSASIHEGKKRVFAPANAMPVSKLRRTVSKRSGIVENLNHRKSWNAWLLSPPPPPPSTLTNSLYQKKAKESCNSNIEDKSWLHPGEYTFLYRSYVNFEEAGAIRKKWGHLRQWLGFVPVRPGVMTIYPSSPGNKNGKQRVTLEEDVRYRIFTKVNIRWNGIIHGDCMMINKDFESNLDDNFGRNNNNNNKKKEKSKKKHYIEWTDTEMTMGKVYTKNPEGAERLRKELWNIIKVEDGVVVFERGDLGRLAYGRDV